MLVGLRALERLRTAERTFSHHHATLIIVSFVLFMFLAVVIDVWVGATVYWAIGAIASFEEALYFSTTSFTTILTRVAHPKIGAQVQPLGDSVDELVSLRCHFVTHRT